MKQEREELEEEMKDKKEEYEEMQEKLEDVDLDEMKEERDELKEKLSDLKNEVDNIEDDIEDIGDKEDKIEDRKEEIEDLQDDIDELEVEYDDLEEDLDEAEEKKNELQNNYERLDQKINDDEESLEDKEDNLEDEQERLEDKQEEFEDLEEELGELRELEERINEVEEALEIYSQSETQMRDVNIQRLEQKVYKWYQELAARHEFKQLSIDRDDYRLKGIPMNADREYSISDYQGGGQTTLTALAYQLALADMTGSNDFMMIDEPTDATDSENRESLLEMIHNAVQQFSQILLITHHGVGREKANNIIRIEKVDERESKVTYPMEE
jgi:ATPase involved in DNA repair